MNHNFWHVFVDFLLIALIIIRNGGFKHGATPCLSINAIVGSLLALMNVQLLFEIVEKMGFLQGLPLAFLIVGLAFIVVAFNQYQLSLTILPFIYFFVTLLFATTLDPLLVLAKLITGWFACLIIALTTKQVAQSGYRLEQSSTVDPLYRLGGGVALSAVLILIASNPRFVLPVLPETAVFLNVVIILLVGLGALGIFFAGSPLNSGLALLLFLIGFEIYYSYLGPTTRTNLLFAAANLGIALLVSYLIMPTHNTSRQISQ